MTAFRRILVGLGLDATRTSMSEGSTRALGKLAAIASREGAHVTLLHSTAADEHWSNKERGYVYREEGLPEAGLAALQAAEAQLRDQGLEASLQLREERADRAILRYVASHPIDLVLAGKRSDTEIEKEGARLGSVAMNLLRHCPCSLWVARPGDRALRNVLVATDLSEVGARAVRTAAHVARVMDAKLHVVHALNVPLMVSKEGDASVKEWIEQSLASLEAESRALASEEGVSESAIHSGVGAPSALVMEAVERYDIDLTVMGTVSRGGLPGFLVGNTAERLVDRLPCSLLVVKPEEFGLPAHALD